MPTGPFPTFLRTTAPAAVSIASSGGTHSYTTAFPTIENPLSESGKWLNGGTDGRDWCDMRVTANGAVLAGASGTQDAMAILKASAVAFDPDQRATATVYLNTITNSEIHLWLRTTLTTGSLTGYVFTFKIGASQITRFNGAIGDYTILAPFADAMYTLADGDVVEARAIGPLLLAFVNGKLVNWAVDSTYTSGQPGIGGWASTVPDDLTNVGFKDVAFSDDVPQYGGYGARTTALSTVDFTFPGSVAAGATVVVGVVHYEDTPAADAVTKQAGTCSIESFTRDAYLAGTSGRRGLACYSARVTSAGTLTVRYTIAAPWYIAMACAALLDVKASARVGATDTNSGTGTDHTTHSMDTVAGSALLYVVSEAETASGMRAFSDQVIMNGQNAGAFTFGAQLKLAAATPNTLTDVIVGDSVTWEVLAVEYLAG